MSVGLSKEQVRFLEESNLSPSQVNLLAKDETRRLRTKWEESYIQPFEKNVEGQRIILHRGACCVKDAKSNGYNWHIFSYDLAPSKTVDVAYFQHNQVRQESVIVLWEDCDFIGIRISSALLKELNFDVPQDLYIFPDDISWTFVSTHENGPLGPYYAVRK